MATIVGTTFAQHCNEFLIQLDQLESNAIRMKGIFRSSLNCLEKKTEELFQKFSQESLSDPHPHVDLIREKIAILKTHPMARMSEESPIVKASEEVSEPYELDVSPTFSSPFEEFKSTFARLQLARRATCKLSQKKVRFSKVSIEASDIPDFCLDGPHFPSDCKKTSYTLSTPRYGIKDIVNTESVQLRSYKTDLPLFFSSYESKKIIDQLLSLSLGELQRLKAVLHAILFENPEIASFHKLSITAEILSHMFGIKLGVWNEESLSLVLSNLEKIDLIEPEVPSISLEGHLSIYLSIFDFVYAIPTESADLFSKSLKPLILAAPALIGSFSIMIAEKNYYKVSPKFPALFWNRDKASDQILRLYHFIQRAQRDLEILKKFSCLPSETKALIKTHLTAVFEVTDEAGKEERIALANAFLESVVGSMSYALDEKALKILSLYLEI